MAPTENLHKGHRQKVREQYMENGLKGMADHNVLEFLLFFGIPQKDTNELAHRLLQRFGSFADVLRADVAELKAVSGMTENAACLLNLVLPVYQRYCKSLSKKKMTFRDIREIEDYVRPYFADATKERVFLLCLDDQKRLLALRSLNEGSLGEVFVDMRAVAAVLLETKAKAAVLIHNHPNGIALPSGNDVAVTRMVYTFLKQMGVQLLDHLILTEKDRCSLASARCSSHIFYELDAEDEKQN